MLVEYLRPYQELIEKLLLNDSYPSEIAAQLIDSGLDKKKATVERRIREFRDYFFSDKEIIAENVKLAHQKQRAQDINRIERKSFRSFARLDNAVTEFNKELVAILKKDGLKTSTSKHDAKGKCKMILHLSDTHFNELVDLPNNQFDFAVAGMRLKKLVNETKSLGKWKGCNRLIVAFGGDLLNSDRRLDEMLSMATNRAKATQLSIRLLKMMLVDLNTHFNITCVGVTGNESRAKQELGWTDILATDSYDFTIYDTLRIIFEDAKGISFEPMKANEEIFTVNGKTFLLIHGHQVKANLQQSVQQIIGKYATKGITIDYVLFGHIHTSAVGDYFSRNSSLVGSNAYSEEALNFVSKAAQNIHLVYESNTINSMKIDLQDIEGIKGYPIESDVDAYNAKSVAKIRPLTTIVKVVI